MPAIPILLAIVGSIISGLVFRTLASLGFAYLAYTGINSMVNNVRSYAQGLFGDLPPAVYAICGIAKLDICFNIVMAAIIARLVLAGMDKVSGTITALALTAKAGGE